MFQMAKIKKLPTPKTKREVSIAYISQAEKEMSDEEFSKWEEVLKEIDKNPEINTQQKRTNAMKREYIKLYLPQLAEGKQLINLADIARAEREKAKKKEEAKKKAAEKKKDKGNEKK